MKPLRRHSLTLIFGLMALGYFAVNVLHRNKWQLPLVQRTTVQLFWKNQTVFTAPWFSLALPDEEIFFDAGSRVLAGLGGSLRYVLNNTPTTLIWAKKQNESVAVLREEVPYQFPHPDDFMELGYLSFLRKLTDYYTPKGVHLIFVPVPTKLAFNRSLFSKLPSEDAYLFPRTSEEDFDQSYNRVVASFDDHTVNVNQIFKAWLTTHPQQDLYVPMDTHWSSLGIALTAQGVLQKMKTWNFVDQVPPVQLEQTDDPKFSYDLFNYFFLPKEFAEQRPEFQWKENRYLLGKASVSPAYHSTLLLVGTSYSSRLQHSRFSLAELLASSLGTNVKDASFPGSHAVHAFERLKALKFQLHPDDILVVEYAFRQPFGKITPDQLIEVTPAPERALSSKN